MKSESPTDKTAGLAPRIAAFLAGFAVCTWTFARKQAGRADSGASRELRAAIGDLEARMAAQESAAEERFARIESRLDEHVAKLAEVPSTTQIVAAMEQVLLKSMSALDGRLIAQAHSIEVLRTTVSQTDSVLERVLESLDSLQTDAEPASASERARLELTR